jgi:hypothetical protein
MNSINSVTDNDPNLPDNNQQSRRSAIAAALFILGLLLALIGFPVSMYFVIDAATAAGASETGYIVFDCAAIAVWLVFLAFVLWKRRSRPFGMGLLVGGVIIGILLGICASTGPLVIH